MIIAMKERSIQKNADYFWLSAVRPTLISAVIYAVIKQLACILLSALFVDELVMIVSIVEQKELA